MKDVKDKEDLGVLENPDKQQIKISWWKKPDLDGYLIYVPKDATEDQIQEKVHDFMEKELDTYEWEFANDGKGMGNVRDYESGCLCEGY